MLMKVSNLCYALDRATLAGSQEDWGENSQALFDLYKSLSKRLGEQVVRLAGEAADDVIAAVSSLILLPEEVECLPILHKSLETPVRPFTYLVTSQAISL